MTDVSSDDAIYREDDSLLEKVFYGAELALLIMLFAVPILIIGFLMKVHEVLGRAF